MFPRAGAAIRGKIGRLAAALIAQRLLVGPTGIVGECGSIRGRGGVPLFGEPLQQNIVVSKAVAFGFF